ncbi:MAG: hypothetical protein KDD40_05465 [Bdellovibrionales bacterium]|nr:hypothetical protein [Bdellovibrionales bacterium]
MNQHPLSLINKIKDWPEVQAVKGCGAQGADTIVILCDDDSSLRLVEQCKNLGLEFVGDKLTLCEGLSFSFTQKNSQESEKLKFSLSSSTHKMSEGEIEL